MATLPKTDQERLENFLNILPEKEMLDFFTNLNKHLLFRPRHCFDVFVHSYSKHLKAPSSNFKNKVVQKEFVKFNKSTEEFIKFLKNDFFDIFEDQHKNYDDYTLKSEVNVSSLRIKVILKMTQKLEEAYLNFIKVAFSKILIEPKEKVQIYFSPLKGIYRTLNNKELVYGIRKGENRFKILSYIQNNEGVRGNDILKHLNKTSGPEGQKVVAKEISEINKKFTNNLKVTTKLIIGTTTSGYLINPEYILSQK